MDEQTRIRFEHPTDNLDDRGIIVRYNVGDAGPAEWADEVGRELFQTVGRMIYIRPDREGQPDWATAMLVAKAVLDASEGGIPYSDVAVWDWCLEQYVVVTDWHDSPYRFGQVIPSPTE